MASIDIRNFVDVNILYRKQPEIKSTRDTVVLYTDDEAFLTGTETEHTFDSFESVLSTYMTNTGETQVEIEADGSLVGYHYAKIYFSNGGIKLRMIKITSSETTSSMVTKIQDLPDEQIVIGIAKSSQAPSAHLTMVNSIASAYNALQTSYGIKQKIFLSFDSITGDALETVQDTSNLAVKLVQFKDTLTVPRGAEMTIAAYLSKIDVYKQGDILDYCYTEEKVPAFENEDTIDFNAAITRVLTNNGNIDVKLANVVRNVGGNLTNGEDLVNKYVLIILHQTLSQSVFNTLTQKIKNNSGIAALYATINQELNKYLNSNYLTTDKVWTYENLTVVRNGKEYTLITKGTALLQGYKVVILPLSSLTDQEKQERKAPYIYVILADSYGIRKVTIDGEVI